MNGSGEAPPGPAKPPPPPKPGKPPPSVGFSTKFLPSTGFLSKPVDLSMTGFSGPFSNRLSIRIFESNSFSLKSLVSEMSFARDFTMAHLTPSVAVIVAAEALMFVTETQVSTPA